MRPLYRTALAVLFGLIMVGLHLSSLGRLMEREYGLPFLYMLRGDLETPPGALVVGLDNQSVQWLNRQMTFVNPDDASTRTRRIDLTAPDLGGCLSERDREDLDAATNINHIPRSVHTCLLERLTAGQAPVITFDINFRSEKPKDALFAKAIERAEKVLLFVRFSSSRTDLMLERFPPRDMFAKAALDQIAFQLDSARGEIVTGYLTQYPKSVTFPDLKAMPDRTWEVFTGKTLPPPETPVQPIWMYGPPGAVPTVRLRDVFDPEASGLPDDLSQTAVFIGSSDPEDAAIDDHFPVPNTGRGAALIGGVELAATAFLNRLHGTRLTRPDLAYKALIVFGIAFLGGILILSLARWRLWLALGVVSLGYTLAAWMAFERSLVWLPVAVPVFVVPLCLALAAISVRYLFARALVTRLAPKQVAARLMDGTSAERRAARSEEATIMFTDLVGSTRMAERLEHERYSYLANRYYDTVTDLVDNHRGMVLEFQGDGVVAMFPKSVSGPDHAAWACKAALALVRQLDLENMLMADMPALRIRIGLNSGVTTTGDIGARRRFNFKALGDVVNVTARLEQHAKRLGFDEGHVILLSETTAELAPDMAGHMRPMGQMALRGRDREISVYALTATLAAE